MSLGSNPIVIPRHDPNFIDLCSSPDNMDASKSKSTSGNSSSSKNFSNLKALPNINLKNSLSTALENFNSVDDSIQSTAVEIDVEIVLNALVSVTKKVNKVIKKSKKKVNNLIDKCFPKKIR